VAELKLRSTVDNSSARAGFEQLRKMGAGVEQQLGSAMKGIGAAFSVGAVIQLGREAVELGSKISDLSVQTGLSIQQFQAMSLAVRDAGAEEDRLLQVMAKLRDSQAQVIAGNKASIDSWARIGVAQGDVIRSSPAELLETVAKKFAAAGTDGAAFGAVLDIVGARNAPQLTEALQRLARDGYDGLARSAEAAGQVVSASAAMQLDAFGDMAARARRATVGAVGEIVAPLARGLSLVDAFRQGSREKFLEQAEEGGYWGAYFDTAKLKEQMYAGYLAVEEFKKSIEPKEDTGGLLTIDDLASRDRRVAEAKAEADKTASEAAAKAEEKALKDVDTLRERIAGLEQKRQYDRLLSAERILALERDIAEQRRIAQATPESAGDERILALERDIAEKRRIAQATPESAGDATVTVHPTIDRAAAEAALKAAQDAFRTLPVDATPEARKDAQTRLQQAQAAMPGAVGEQARLEAMERLLKLEDELAKARDEADKERWAAEEKIYEAQKRRGALKDRRDKDIAEAKLEPLGGMSEPADRLAGIGGFGSDSINPYVRMAERQVAVLERIEQIERRAATALENLDGGYA